MKELSPDDRPREKLLRHSAAALGDNELVALVLGSGFRGAGALRVANELLSARGGIHGLVRSTIDDLARTAGVGSAKAAQLLAALELGPVRGRSSSSGSCCSTPNTASCEQRSSRQER